MQDLRGLIREFLYLKKDQANRPKTIGLIPSGNPLLGNQLNPNQYYLYWIPAAAFAAFG